MTREESINKWIIPALKNTWNDKKCEEVLKALEQKPCEDAVSRQDVLNAVTMAEVRWKAIENINKLPPVNPQSKTGHWIRFKEFENGYYHIKCSECGQYWSVDGHSKVFKHCFNCGAKMESEG